MEPVKWSFRLKEKDTGKDKWISINYLAYSTIEENNRGGEQTNDFLQQQLKDGTNRWAIDQLVSGKYDIYEIHINSSIPINTNSYINARMADIVRRIAGKSKNEVAFIRKIDIGFTLSRQSKDSFKELIKLLYESHALIGLITMHTEGLENTPFEFLAQAGFIHELGQYSNEMAVAYKTAIKLF